MKKAITIMILLACIGLSPSLLAQEKGSASPIISIPQEARAKLKAVRTIAIFLSCNDVLLTRIVENAFAIHLTNAGFTVINREMLEKSVGEEVAKKRQEKSEGAINALDIGMVVNADSILTGTLIIESGDQTLFLVKVATVQLVDVTGGRTLINVLFESEKGQSFQIIVKKFVDILRQNMM